MRKYRIRIEKMLCIIKDVPFLLPPVLRLGNEEFGLVHAELLGGVDSELVENGLHLKLKKN